ncbi:hypothetical protein [Deinococcus marmoris]|uniref:hypothetical protein n=1 Tax=Deinococcus marmoris TaxID=249408 RepID=UPI001115396C|nr:hypothetical protein [Deinococcus marmoris]
MVMDFSLEHLSEWQYQEKRLLGISILARSRASHKCPECWDNDCPSDVRFSDGNGQDDVNTAERNNARFSTSDLIEQYQSRHNKIRDRKRLQFSLGKPKVRHAF